MRTRPVGVWIVVAALVPGVALAQGKPAPKPATAAAKEDPKQKYAGAVKKFNDKDYAGALVDFQQLDALKSTPQSQRYVALCLDKLGRTAEAVSWYEKFVANPPGKLQAEFDEAKKRLEELTKKAAPKLHVESTPAGAVILVDGKAFGITPKDLDVFPPGKHHIHLELPGYEPVDKEVDASEKELRAQLDKKAEPVDVPPPPPPPPGEDTTTAPAPTQDDGSSNSVKPPTFIPALVTGGLAVLSLGFGVGFGVAALGNKSDFDKNPAESSADAGRTNAVVCEMMFGAAIMLGVTSAVLFFSKGGAAKPATALTIHPHPIVTQHGGGVGALVRF